jgi:hypothetical protein
LTSSTCKLVITLSSGNSVTVQQAFKLKMLQGNQINDARKWTPYLYPVQHQCPEVGQSTYLLSWWISRKMNNYQYLPVLNILRLWAGENKTITEYYVQLLQLELVGDLQSFPWINHTISALQTLKLDVVWTGQIHQSATIPIQASKYLGMWQSNAHLQDLHLLWGWCHRLIRHHILADNCSWLQSSPIIGTWNTSLATQHSTNNIQILWLSWGPGIGKSSG